jgi:hypothetical protein
MKLILNTMQFVQNMGIDGVFANKRSYHCKVNTKEIMSFYSFLADHYELSKFVLPKKLPRNDSMNETEKQLLIELMNEKDFYEINTIIRKRYLES